MQQPVDTRNIDGTFLVYRDAGGDIDIHFKPDALEPDVPVYWRMTREQARRLKRALERVIP